MTQVLQSINLPLQIFECIVYIVVWQVIIYFRDIYLNVRAGAALRAEVVVIAKRILADDNATPEACKAAVWLLESVFERRTLLERTGWHQKNVFSRMEQSVPKDGFPGALPTVRIIIGAHYNDWLEGVKYLSLLSIMESRVLGKSIRRLLPKSDYNLHDLFEPGEMFKFKVPKPVRKQTAEAETLGEFVHVAAGLPDISKVVDRVAKGFCTP